jgi:putative flippase GtrA
MAIINHLFCNDLWTFGDTSLRQPNKYQLLKQFLKFHPSYIDGVILGLMLLVIFYKNIYINKYAALAMMLVAVSFRNICLTYKLDWQTTKVDNITIRQHEV